MSLASQSFSLARPLLHAIDPENAHRLTLALLKLMPGRASMPHPKLAVGAFGLEFPNPLGLAAGFDKNAEVPDAMLGLGFGFVETGTVTPMPQAGNPRPRLFRLKADRAVINRMGFNNEGHAKVLARLKARRAGKAIVGVNLGANKNSADRVADYVQGIAMFSDASDYLTINISSPNTPGLRALQSKDDLRSLLSRLNEERARQRRRPPMLLKIAPDLGEGELEDIAHCCGRGAVDGLIVSNTTLRREGLTSLHAGEQGGLSGEPLFNLSTQVLARMFLLTDGNLPLVGVGGIHDADSAWAKITAGATLLQLYSALVFQGPALVAAIIEGLAKRLAGSGAGSLADIRGSSARRLAHQGLSGR